MVKTVPLTVPEVSPRSLPNPQRCSSARAGVADTVLAATIAVRAAAQVHRENELAIY